MVLISLHTSDQYFDFFLRIERADPGAFSEGVRAPAVVDLALRERIVPDTVHRSSLDHLTVHVLCQEEDPQRLGIG